jgi:hypothetical protein
MNGDGRDDLLGTWDGQGVFYRDSISGAWVKIASQATLITTGDFDGDGIDDLAGIWPTQGGVWVKHSHTGVWMLLSTTARAISTGKMHAASLPMASPETEALALTMPMGGAETGPEAALRSRDESRDGPGGARFIYMEEPNLHPKEDAAEKLARRASPGEPLFVSQEEKNVVPGEAKKEEKAVPDTKKKSQKEAR